MPFRSGSISYARFAVRGGPTAVTTELLDQLADNVLKPPSIGAPPELQAGWSAGRHVFDAEFDPEAVVYGETLLIGIRIDTNRVPPELRRAFRAMAEQTRALESPTGALSGRERREAREEAEEKCREELATNRFRRSKLVPVVWHVDDGLLFAPIFSDTAGEIVRSLVQETFGAKLELLSAGRLAEEILAARGRRREYEDVAPSAFTPAPPSADGLDGRPADAPPVPWSSHGPEPKDFLGNEFLFWLWNRCETGSAMISTSRGEVAVAFDRLLDMQCAWDVTGTASLRADAPTRLPEARAALRIGKWPRKVGLVVATGGEQWECSVQGDRFIVGGARLARPTEPPATPREAIEARLSALRTLDRGLVGLYETFLEQRTGSSWNTARQAVRGWISGSAAAQTTAGAHHGGPRRDTEVEMGVEIVAPTQEAQVQ